MDILEKVRVNPEICSVELAFTGTVAPSSIPDWQQFYNSITTNTDFSKTYIGLASVSFAEESSETAAGPLYKQEVSFRFPSTDGNRSERIALMQNIKFVKLNLTNGGAVLIGRNDFKQNARPKVKIKTNMKTAEVSIATVSMFPTGFTPALDLFGLPTLIPLTLIK